MTGVDVHHVHYERVDGTGLAEITIEGPPDELISRVREIFQLFLGGQGLWRIKTLKFSSVEDEPHRWLLEAAANLLKDDAEFAIQAELHEPTAIGRRRPAS